MMKLTLYFVLIYQVVQLTQGFLPFQAVNELVFTPPGCIACYKAEAYNYFQNLNRLTPNCAQQEIYYFNAIPAKYLFSHICVYQTGTGFQSKYDSLQNYGNQVLQKFRKCLNNKKLSPAGKRYLKTFTSTFQKARVQCEDGNFLEKGLKGMRQFYLGTLTPSPPAPSRRRQERKNKPLQKLSPGELEPVSKKTTPVIKKKAPIIKALPLSNNVPSKHFDNSEDEKLSPGELEPVSKKTTPVIKKKKAPIVETLPLSNNVPSEHFDNSEDEQEEQEEILELPSNVETELENMNDTDPNLLENLVGAPNSEPLLIEESIEPDAKNKENDNEIYKETPEHPLNATKQQNYVDNTNTVPLENSVDPLEPQPSPTMANNLPENTDTPNDEPTQHTTSPVVDKIPTSDDTTVPTTSPTTDTSVETQNDEMKPKNIKDSSSTQPAPVTNEKTPEVLPQIQKDQSTAQVSPTPLSDETSSDNSHVETPKDQPPPEVDNNSDKIKEGIPSIYNATTEDLPQVQNDPNHILVPPEEPHTFMPVGNTETNSPEFPAGNEMSTLTKDPSVKDSLDLLEHKSKPPPTIQDEPLKKSSKPTSEVQIESQENDNTPKDSLQPQNDDITSLDNAKPTQNYDSSDENSSKQSSEDQPTLDTTDILTPELSPETTQDQLVSTDNVPVEALPENTQTLELLPETAKDQSVLTDDLPIEALPENQFEDANKSIPDPTSLNIPSDDSSKTEENNLGEELETFKDQSASTDDKPAEALSETQSEDPSSPTIFLNDTTSKSKPNDSATENPTKFENPDDTSKENNEILPTDPESLQPMNLVEQISTPADDTPPSRDDITETTLQESAKNESPTSTLSQDDAPSDAPTKEELDENLQNALTNFAIDTALQNDPEPEDKIISKHNDEINKEDSVKSEIDTSSLDSSELRDQYLNKPDQNLEPPSTSLEDDSIKTEDSVPEVTSPYPALENPPEMETNDQSIESIPPASDLTPSEDSFPQDTSDGSESPTEEKIDNSSSNPENISSLKQSEKNDLIPETDTNSEPDNILTTTSPTNDSFIQTSATSPEDQPFEPQKAELEFTETNPTNVQADQSSGAQDEVFQDNPSESTEADQGNWNPIPIE